MAPQAPPAKLGPGDPLPRLVLPNLSGSRADFSHQSIAGSTLVLWLMPRAPTAEQLAPAAALVEKLADLEAQLFVIAAETPNAGEVIASLPICLDPERRLAAVLGIEGGCIVVVDPRGRIADLLDDGAVIQAWNHCRAIHATSTPSIRSSTAPVLIVPGVVDPAQCARLIEYWTHGEKQENLVASSRDAQDGRVATKRRSDVMIQDKGLFELLKTRLMTRVLPELKRAFALEVASFEALRIGCYDAAQGGFFRRHRDNATPYTAHRSFAMSLNLNTGAYEGGQLRFPEFGRELYEADAGGAVLFSCNLLHEALPVTRGRRFAVFTFFSNAAGAVYERKMIEQQVAAGRKGVRIG